MEWPQIKQTESQKWTICLEHISGIRMPVFGIRSILLSGY